MKRSSGMAWWNVGAASCCLHRYIYCRVSSLLFEVGRLLGIPACPGAPR